MSMRQILIDFDVHKRIESERSSFDETPNDVLRRLLGLSEIPKQPQESDRIIATKNGGLYASNTYIPAGTRLRKILKGEVHEAEVVDRGIRYKGRTFDSPSAAAVKAAGNSVNGWIFWDYFDETTGEWRVLDTLRRAVNRAKRK